MRRLCLLLAVFAAASIGAACGETAVSPGDGSGGSHASVAAENKSKTATDARPSHQKVSKKAQDSSPSELAMNEMSVFSRPRTEEDVLPSSLSYLLADKACTDDFRSQYGSCIGEDIQ